MANAETKKETKKEVKNGLDNFITKNHDNHKQGETVVKEAFGVVIETNY